MTSEVLSHVPFSAAHLLASAHSTSRSSSRSDLFPTKTVTRCGLPRAFASASHRERFANDSRLRERVIEQPAHVVISMPTYFVMS